MTAPSPIPHGEVMRMVEEIIKKCEANPNHPRPSDKEIDFLKDCSQRAARFKESFHFSEPQADWLREIWHRTCAEDRLDALRAPD